MEEIHKENKIIVQISLEELRRMIKGEVLEGYRVKLMRDLQDD